MRSQKNWKKCLYFWFCLGNNNICLLTTVLWWSRSTNRIEKQCTNQLTQLTKQRNVWELFFYVCLVFISFLFHSCAPLMLFHSLHPFPLPFEINKWWKFSIKVYRNALVILEKRTWTKLSCDINSFILAVKLLSINTTTILPSPPPMELKSSVMLIPFYVGMNFCACHCHPPPQERSLRQKIIQSAALFSIFRSILCYTHTTNNKDTVW